MNVTSYYPFANLVCSLLLLLFLTACEGPNGERSTSDRTPPEKPHATATTGGKIRLYNWEDYTGSETIEKFTEATGIEVELITFDDDEAVIAALQSGGIETDIIVVSQSLAIEMTKAKLLLPIDYQSLSNAIHLKEEYVPQPDETGNRYWVPYLWGTSGIVVNTEYITVDYDSWALLWDSRYKGRIAMLNNAFEVTAAAAKMLGYGVNPTEQQLVRVEQALLEQKAILHGYHGPSKSMELMRNETIWAAHIYNGDGLVLADEDQRMRFITPREGTALWLDVFVIPKIAREPGKAHTFINFIHTPELMAAIASEYWYATSNKAAEASMDPQVLAAKEVYPPPEILEKSEFFQYLGGGESVRKRTEIWSRLMSQ